VTVLLVLFGARKSSVSRGVTVGLKLHQSSLSIPDLFISSKTVIAAQSLMRAVLGWLLSNLLFSLLLFLRLFTLNLKMALSNYMGLLDLLFSNVLTIVR
jgi:hypothetical protein